MDVDREVISELTSLFPNANDHTWFDATTLLQDGSDIQMVPISTSPFPNQPINSQNSQGRNLQQQVQPTTQAINGPFTDLED